MAGEEILTLEVLMEDIRNEVEPFGEQPYTRTDQLLKRSIGRTMSKWVKLTRCLFSENINFVPGNDPGPYMLSTQAHWDINGTDRPMIELTAVYSEGVAVPEIGLANLLHSVPDYRERAPQDDPDAWMRVGRGIEFYPRLATPVANSFMVAGFYLHPIITEATDDDTVIELPHDMQMDFTRYCSAMVIRQYDGEDQGRAYKNLLAEAAANIQYWQKDQRDPTITDWEPTEPSVVTLQ